VKKVVSRFGHPWLAVIALAGQADARAVVLEVRLSGELVATGGRRGLCRQNSYHRLDGHEGRSSHEQRGGDGQRNGDDRY
jgi:hypothetical protein